MNIFKIGLTWYSCNYLLQYYFPNEHRQLRILLTNVVNTVLNKCEKISISFFVQIIYIYSCAEIKFKKYCSPLIEKYTDNNSCSEFKIRINYYNFNFECCNEIHTNSSLKWLKDNLSISPKAEYKYHTITNTPTNQTLLEIKEDIIYETVEFKSFINHFLSINLIIPNVDPINIVLKKDNYDFYIVGNTIDKTFINHYLKNIISIEEYIDNYTLEVIDNNVNMFTLTQDEYIFLENEFNYIIKKHISTLDNICIDKSESKETLSEKSSSSDNEFIKVE